MRLGFSTLLRNITCRYLRRINNQRWAIFFRIHAFIEFLFCFLIWNWKKKYFAADVFVVKIIFDYLSIGNRFSFSCIRKWVPTYLRKLIKSLLVYKGFLWGKFICVGEKKRCELQLEKKNICSRVWKFLKMFSFQ